MVEITKSFDGKRPQTWIRLTGTGRKAVDEHWNGWTGCAAAPGAGGRAAPPGRSRAPSQLTHVSRRGVSERYRMGISPSRQARRPLLCLSHARGPRQIRAAVWVLLATMRRRRTSCR